MFRGRDHAGRVIAPGIFSFAIVFLLAKSGDYHLLEPGSTARAVLQRLNHAGIFFLIAGTFTPIHGLLFTRSLRFCQSRVAPVGVGRVADANQYHLSPICINSEFVRNML